MRFYFGNDDSRSIWHQVLPLTLGSHAHLWIRTPISEAEWQRLLFLLETMKPGLVTATDPGKERA